jgi:hypothetical protein
MNEIRTSTGTSWLDRYERCFDNLLRIAWLVFIIKIVFYGYSS